VGTLKRRLERVRERTGLERHELVCPECGAEFVVWGAAAFEVLLCAEWVMHTGATIYRATPSDVAALFDHEHDPSRFLDQKTGLPFLSDEVSGMRVFGPASKWELSPRVRA